MIRRLALPPSFAALALIALAFVVPGLAGHDPWKTFDVITIEITHQMQLGGDWLVPHVAGEPWLEDPPLYPWIALGFAKALGWAFEFHEAVRLASGALLLGALGLLYLAARGWAAQKGENQERRAAGAGAVLLLIGSVGLIVHAHEAVDDLASLAASCGAFAALPLAARRPLAAGAAFGAALGAAFLSTGFVVPLALAAAVLLAHLACDEWRTRRGAAFLAVAAPVALAIGASWPLALWLRSPALFGEWWGQTARLHGSFLHNLGYYVVLASWFAWPAWPLAVWAAWTRRRRGREARQFVPLAAALFSLAGISLAGPDQDVNGIVLLAPLALLAAPVITQLRRGAAAALDWFGVMTFGVFAGLVWLGYVAMIAGVPPRIAHNFAKLAPGFSAHFHLLPFAVALAATLGWLYLVLFTAPSPTRGVTRWAAGVALLWATFATLWLPWADYLSSYRPVALQIKSLLPPGATCISRWKLGDAQRAALSYHAGIVTNELDPLEPCPLLLTQGSPGRKASAPGPGWINLADIGRPGDRDERIRLYRRQK
jgi:4-amino-4-deoxy-L-arabinose transferase-like glycosyltransferase